MFQTRLAMMLVNTQPEVYITGIISCEMPFVHMSRNELVKAARRCPTPPTHLMFIDQDTSVYPGTIQRLLSFKKRVIGAVVYSRNPPHKPVVYHFHPTFSHMDADFPGPDAEPFHVKGGGIGMAAALIEMTVFNDLEEKFGTQTWFQSPLLVDPAMPIDKQESVIGEDVFFCKRLDQAGIEVWVDPKDQTEHTAYMTICGDLFRATREARQTG